MIVIKNTLLLLLRIAAVLFAISVSQKKRLYQNRFLSLDDIRLSYCTTGGKKQPIVLLHGWGQEKETWENVMLALSKTYTVYAFDLPGFGESSLPNRPLSVTNYAEIIHDALKVFTKKRVILLGHSFGGKIAIELATLYPHTIDSIILYSADLGIQKTPTEKLLFVFLSLSQIYPFRLVVQGYLAMRKKSFTRYLFLAKTYQQNKHYTAKKILPQIKTRVLLLYGASDPVTRLGTAKQIESHLPKATLRILPKSTHLAHIEQPDVFLKHITAFLQNGLTNLLGY